MNIYLAFFVIAIISYFIGTINFARIIAWHGRRKDITKLGSGNPGTMNMLRNFGFVTAFATMLAEVFKAGLCCFIVKICMQGTGYETLAYYFAGLFVVLGFDFPVYFNFKGGKGVACLAGVFFFSEMWWVALILFAVGVIQIVITEYGSVSSFIFIIGMSIAVTVNAFLTGIPNTWAIIVIVWGLAILTILKHHENIRRLFKGEEKKANFKSSIKKMFKKQRGVEEISEDSVESEPETEIIIEDKEDK